MLTPGQLPDLRWLEIDLLLEARQPPRRAHPLVVLEALLKGVFEAIGPDAATSKQLWHWPGADLDSIGWEAGTRIPLVVQLFNLPPAALPRWQAALQARLARPGQNFTLCQAGPARVVGVPAPMASTATAQTLELLTPLPLPHQPGHPRTALDGAGFLHLCQTRLRKLFGCEAHLPPPPDIDTSAWRYLRIVHRSRSQGGHPMFLNGCVGPLTLSGPHLPDWQPWLALFACVGLGERLSFSQGRLRLATAAPPPPAQAPLRLRRPFVLQADTPCVLRLDNANLVVCTEEDIPVDRVPLMRLASVEVQSPARLTAALLHACAEEGIPVLLAAPGKTLVPIVGGQAEATRNRTLARHHAVWQATAPADRVRIAAALVDAKLAGQARLVQGRYQAGDHQHLARLQRARARLPLADSLAVVRGWEGWASRHHYQWWARFAAPLGRFQQRRTHGQSPDPLNIALNYGYALLRNRVAVALRLAGLDPYLGILHEANGRHEALTSDLMEPYRPEIDRLVLRLINLRRLRPEDFNPTEDGTLQMQSAARRRFVQSFAQLCEGNPHEGGARLKARLWTDVRAYRRAVLNGDLTHWQPLTGLPATEDADDPAPDTPLP
jgi:CRISPR-associated protein Cas1